MQYLDFVNLFKKQIFSLDKYRQLRLCVSVCKKLYPDYVAFAQKENWGDPDILLDAIIFCDNVRFENIDKTAVQKFLAEVEKITPDTEDFEDQLVSYALNACVAACETLDFLLDNNPERVFDVGTCLTDTVDIKIQEKESLSEEQINTNPLMIEARDYLIEESR